MAAAFRAVNGEPTITEEAMTPSPATPRADAAARLPHSHPPHPLRAADDATTPTRASFTPAGQKPLPSDPFPPVPEHERPRRGNSQHSAKSSSRRDSVDVDMDDSDGEADDAVSDDESVNADGSRSGKKKKSQRFYCTDYPPCNLSFTRSEHLARHIRYAQLALPLVPLVSVAWEC